MKFIYTIIAAGFVLTACGQKSQTSQTIAASTEQKADTGKVITVVTPQEFSTRMQTSPGVLLDVRTPGEYKKGFIKGARLLDIFSDNFDTELNKLDRNATYYVYCASGGRSAECAEKMQDLGFKHVYDLDGGMGAWRNAGLPVEMPQP